MSYKTDQHRLWHRGREFHFVSYDAALPNPRTGEPARPATWFLMAAGKRWPVFPQATNQDPDELVAELVSWLEHHVFAARLA